MKNTVIVIMVVVAAIAGAVFVAPMLKPNNTAFAPDSPSPGSQSASKAFSRAWARGFHNDPSHSLEL